MDSSQHPQQQQLYSLPPIQSSSSPNNNQTGTNRRTNPPSRQQPQSQSTSSPLHSHNGIINSANSNVGVGAGQMAILNGISNTTNQSHSSSSVMTSGSPPNQLPHLSTSSQLIVHAGWLMKSPPEKRIWKTKWRRRWFVLKLSGHIPGQYVLEYFVDQSCKKIKGSIDLDQCEQVDAGLQLEIRKENFEFMFDLRTSKRVYYLVASTEDEMNKWVECICSVCGLKMEAVQNELALLPPMVDTSNTTITTTGGGTASGGSAVSSAAASPNASLSSSNANSVNVNSSSTATHEEQRYSPQPSSLTTDNSNSQSQTNNHHQQTNAVPSAVPQNQLSLPPSTQTPQTHSQSSSSTSSSSSTNSSSVSVVPNPNANSVPSQVTSVHTVVPHIPPPPPPPPPPMLNSTNTNNGNGNTSSSGNSSSTSTGLCSSSQSSITSSLNEPSLNYIPISECYTGQRSLASDSSPPPPRPPKPRALQMGLKSQSSLALWPQEQQQQQQSHQQFQHSTSHHSASTLLRGGSQKVVPSQPQLANANTNATTMLNDPRPLYLNHQNQHHQYELCSGLAMVNGVSHQSTSEPQPPVVNRDLKPHRRNAPSCRSMDGSGSPFGSQSSRHTLPRPPPSYPVRGDDMRKSFNTTHTNHSHGHSHSQHLPHHQQRHHSQHSGNNGNLHFFNNNNNSTSHAIVFGEKPNKFLQNHHHMKYNSSINNQNNSEIQYLDLDLDSSEHSTNSQSPRTPFNLDHQAQHQTNDHSTTAAATFNIPPNDHNHNHNNNNNIFTPNANHHHSSSSSSVGLSNGHGPISAVAQHCQSSSTVYKQVDFVKTKAFNDTREKVDSYRHAQESSGSK